MKYSKLLPFSLAGALLAILLCCKGKEDGFRMAALLAESPAIQGKAAFLNTPFVTAGNRVYMVGHQDGSFPEIGWHIQGEMGGIWNHPIKLMDGLDAHLKWEDVTYHLEQANVFINFPFANVHSYDLKEPGLVVKRWQYVPDDKEGLFLQYTLENKSDKVEEIEFNFTGHTDLRPTWLGEKTQMSDGPDNASYNQALDSWLVKDDKNPWYVIFGSDRKSSNHSETKNAYLGKGSSNTLSYKLSIPAGGSESLNFIIAGSYQSEEAALESYKSIKSGAEPLLVEKKRRYQSLARQSKLTVPDKDIQETFEWLKYNCDWLVREVPEVGTGISAGIPDYPWWFGVDSEYALKGYMAIGQSEAVYQTIHLLDSVSEAVNGNGRIIHEMSTNGFVFNKGNINETPQFASLIWEIYQWNGDRAFLQKYFPTIKKGLHWLLTENDSNHNLFPDGFGMMEIHGLDSEMIDVAAYTQRAFADAAEMAKILNEDALAEDYQKKASLLKKNINESFWSEEFNSYADFIGTDVQALHLIDDAIVRADTLNKPWAVEELKQTKKKIRATPSADLRPFVLHHNWVVNTPMEMKIADSVKALKALATAENFVNPFGVFVTGIDRDASAGSDDGSFKGSKVFSYTGAVMTLPTGVQAVAENNYGRPNNALNYLKRMSRTFSYALPGSMYEVSPDYGMMTQAWNIYSFAVPIVQQFFGIRPKASEKRIEIKPSMPDTWDKASLENVLIKDNEVSVYYEKTDQKVVLKIVQLNPAWIIQLVVPREDNVSYDSPNGSWERKNSGNEIIFSSKGTDLELHLTKN